MEIFYLPSYTTKSPNAKKYWLRRKLEMEILQTGDAAEERAILNEELENLNADA